MSVLSVLQKPNDALRTSSKPVEFSAFVENTPDNEKLKQLVKDMVDTMRFHKAAGLAAVQIGILEKVIVVENEKVLINRTLDPLPEPYVLVNGKIISHSDEKNYDLEACLSVSNVEVKVSRFTKILISGFTTDGKIAKVEADGYMARVWQHELHHTEGLLIVDISKMIRNLK